MDYFTDYDNVYAIDAGKLQRELGWQPKTGFDEGIGRTIRWYLENRDWWENIVSGEYKEYYAEIHGDK